MTFDFTPHTRMDKFTTSNQQRFIDSPRPDANSVVSILRSHNYFETEQLVRESLNLLGIPQICNKGDKVLIKPNLSMATPPEIGETTHPSVVGAMVKICKEAGATVSVGDSCVWHLPMEMVLEITGVRTAALEARADEVVDFNETERVDVKIPDGRSINKASIPKCVAEADVIINLPKMKNNVVTLTTLAIKNMLGLIPLKDRHLFHRTPWDAAWVVNDLFKAIKNQHRLTLIDGITGVEGATHAGFVCNPGVIIASQDPIAAETIANTIMGYDPFESPHVQVGMKDGLGTGELSEIDIVGTRLQDVLYPFQRSLVRSVSKYTNVTEYYGGACHACQLATAASPPFVDPDKKYAVVAGARAMIANDLDNVDEVWLIGQCACSQSHQFPGYMEKIKAAKKVMRMPTCPPMTHALEEKIGGVYDQARELGFPDLPIIDAGAVAYTGNTIRPGITKEAEDRKEGRKKTFP